MKIELHSVEYPQEVDEDLHNGLKDVRALQYPLPYVDVKPDQENIQHRLSVMILNLHNRIECCFRHQTIALSRRIEIHH